MGNELKLSLHNFQSISDGELVFHPGINVIIGQSNSGKSATFRALKACLSNPTGSQRFIKKGTTSSAVTLEYNGNQIVWKRTPKESSYVINGETFSKTGSSNAFKIIEDTGFVRDENDVIMNIEEELQLPFPFGISKFELFKLYEDVFCISDSTIILKAAKEQEDGVKEKISSLELTLINNKNKLEELKEFKETVSLDYLKNTRDKLKEKSNRLTKLRDGLPIIKKALLLENIRVPENTFSNKLITLKEFKDLSTTVTKLKKLHVVDKTLKDNYVEFESHLEKHSEHKALLKLVSTLKEIKNLEVPTQEFTSKLEHYSTLKSYKKALKEIQEKIHNKKEELSKIDEKVKGTKDKLKEFKVCPLCHKSIEEN